MYTTFVEEEKIVIRYIKETIASGIGMFNHIILYQL